MKKFLILFLLIPSIAFAGPTGTWGALGSEIIHQFFPTIQAAFLGSGYSLVPSQVLFGDCSDGNVTISAGTTTLTRDMYYNNLTINGTGTLSVQNQRIFVCGTLDLSGAAAFAINGSGNAGQNGAAGGGNGSGGATTAVGTNITGRSGGNAGTGTTGAGAQGVASSGGNCITGTTGGASGAGGAGSAGAGGAVRNAVTVTNFPMRDIITAWFLPQTGSGGAIFVAGGGSGGGSGGGDGTNNGGGGGGGGASGQTIYIAANILKTDGTTAGSAIAAWGGGGGNGGSPTVGNTGGGGGGGGGSGGWIVLKYNTKVGAAVTFLISTPGGNFLGGATGGTGHGTGASGTAGSAGNAGLIQTLNVSTGQSTSDLTGLVTL